MKITIWHNPRCNTSRQALADLEGRGLQPVVYLYLDEKPSRAEIEAMLRKLKLQPSGLLRRGEKEGEGLAGASEAKILAAMVKHPILIQRPIVIGPKGATIARPAAQIAEKIDAVL